jgi:hypothetical protein
VGRWGVLLGGNGSRPCFMATPANLLDFYPLNKKFSFKNKWMYYPPTVLESRPHFFFISP